jgi:hypothetical protein
MFREKINVAHLCLCHAVVWPLPLVHLEEHARPLLLLFQLLQRRLHLLHKYHNITQSIITFVIAGLWIRIRISLSY